MRPSRMSGTELAIGAMKSWTRPAMMSLVASGMPLYATCTISIPAACLNTSPAKWVPLPTPAEARLSWPGFDLARAMSSFIDFAASVGGTTSR